MRAIASLACCFCLMISTGCSTAGGGKVTGDCCLSTQNSVSESFVSLIQGAGFPSDDEPQRFEVIRSQARLQNVWGELFAPNQPPQPAPSVDFSTRMVIVYAAGMKPDGCHSTEIVGVRRLGQRLLVEATETVPGPKCVCTLALVMPFHVVELDRFSGPASLCVRTKPLVCPG